MARQRYQRVREVEMALGHPEPTFILEGCPPKFAAWSFGGGRPFNCSHADCVRWHAGIDVVCNGTPAVLTPELCTIEAVDRNWSIGSKAVFARTATGLYLVFGGTIRGSGDEWNVKEGDEIPQGKPIGRVHDRYGMIHFETYKDDPARISNSRWYIHEPPPEGILNPTNYIQRAAGQEQTLESYTQIRKALLLLGFSPMQAGPWIEEDTVALTEAQELLGLEPDGLWGPKTEEKVRTKLNEMGLNIDAWPTVPVPVPWPEPGEEAPVDGTSKFIRYGLYGLVGVAGLAAARAAWKAYKGVDNESA